MEVKSYWKLGFGILFVVFGLAGIFDLWGNLVFEVPWQVWPVGLIVVGILFIANQRGLAFLAIGLLMVFGIFNGVFYASENYMDGREFSYTFPIGSDAEKVYLNLDYGAGDLKVGSGEEGFILFSGETNDFEDPFMEKTVSDNESIFHISRNGAIGIGDTRWVFGLDRNIVYDVELNYGVSDVELDLRDLKVDELKISEGVSDTKILFGDYPSKVLIQGGLSDVELVFYDDVGVVIKADGGLVSKDFDGFERRDGKWYNSFYDEDGENIEIRFNGGVGDLSAEIVKA